jgi:hypothetical protein
VRLQSPRNSFWVFLSLIKTIGSNLCYIDGAWNRALPSKCIDLRALAYATGGIFVIQDFAILILPIPECLGLQMGRNKKIGVLVMFSVGAMWVFLSIPHQKTNWKQVGEVANEFLLTVLQCVYSQHRSA